jgi:hypothetical protein
MNLRASAHPKAIVMGLALSAVLAAPAMAQESAGGSNPEQPAPQEQPAASNTGGAQYGVDNAAMTQTVPGLVAVLLPNGYAAAPELAPEPVKQAIWGANRIVGRPYKYGGGHNAKFRSRGYDCSGTVSYALFRGGLLESPLDSSSFMKWGERGTGEWITVYTNPGHAFVVIAGLRLDTSAAGDPSRLKGPRWRPALRKTRGFRARHPLAL